MTKCSYCGKKIEGVLPHKCKYCGQIHCNNHILPEDHKCVGLEEHKRQGQERWKNVFTSTTSHKFEEQEEPKPSRTKNKRHKKKREAKDRIKDYFLGKYGDLIYWLKKREYYKYNFERRANYLTTTILIFVASLVGFSIFYSNATKLNEIELWIIKLGGVLILTSLFFAIKFGWRSGKEGINILKRQRNWLKYLIIILIIFLLWQGYTNKDTVLNPVFDMYNKTNFSLFTPISSGKFSFENNTNLSSTSSNANKDNSFISNIGEFLKSEPERKEECIDTFSKLNNIREDYGKKPISWDERAYNLAVDRSKDVYERDYFDHVTPEGECAYSMKGNYGFKNYEDVAENLGGMSYYSKGSVAGNCDEALDGWLTSRGHRYNLLYSTHDGGAIGCYHEICVFLGVNNDGFGRGCYTGDEGSEFWQDAPKQPGEV